MFDRANGPQINVRDCEGCDPSAVALSAIGTPVRTRLPALVAVLSPSALVAKRPRFGRSY
jgi:hypothetical protein